MKSKVDETDKRIVEFLRKNSRITMKELGEKVFLTGQAVKNRVERLEDIGILQRYTVNIDCPVFGYKTHAIIQIKIAKSDIDTLKNLCKEKGGHIIHCYQITGKNNYFFDMVFRDTEEMNIFLEQIEHVYEYELHIVIKEIPDWEL